MDKIRTKLFSATPKFIACVLGVGGTGYLANKSIKTVPASHVAHTNLFGNVSQTKMNSGIQLINPLASMVVMPLLTNNFTSDIDVASNEGLNLSVQINTIYKIDEDKARDIYLKFRYDYENILIKPLIESVLRNIMSSYEAKALYSDKTRDEIKRRMNTEITQKLVDHGINVTDVLINKIRLPTQLQQSIENKLKVEQENEQMEFTIQKRRQEIAFELEKEEMEAKRKQIEAEGIRKFQDIVSKGITSDLIKWKSIDATEKIANSTNTKVVIIGNKDTNGMPIILADK